MHKVTHYLGAALLLLALTLPAPLAVRAQPPAADVAIKLLAVPDRPAAGQQVVLNVTLRDKDDKPLTNASVAVTAETAAAPAANAAMAGHGGMSTSQHNSSARLAATAKAASTPGHYLTTLKLPMEGEWKITVSSGDNSATLNLAVDRPVLENAPASASKKTALIRTAGGEPVEASYLDLSANLADLRSRVGQWQKGDEGSRGIAEEKLERTQAIIASTIWPGSMAAAIDKTKAALPAMAKIIKNKDLTGVAEADKALGDASHDVTHAFYGDWLPTLRGGWFSQMAPHVGYLDLRANIADLQSRVAAWEKGDDGSLNIAKEKAERAQALIQNMATAGIMAGRLQAIENALPAVFAALEKKDVGATRLALQPIASAANELMHEAYTWLEVTKGASDAACIQASYLDLQRNVADLRASASAWQKGDEKSLETALQKAAFLDVVLAHPAWPEALAGPADKTKSATRALVKGLKAKDVSMVGTVDVVLGDASHDVTHAFYGDWLPAMRLGGDTDQLGTVKATSAAHGHDVATVAAGPNYWFVGSLVGLVFVTIGMVPILRRRETATQPVEVK